MEKASKEGRLRRPATKGDWEDQFRKNWPTEGLRFKTLDGFEGRCAESKEKECVRRERGQGNRLPDNKRKLWMPQIHHLNWTTERGQVMVQGRFYKIFLNFTYKSLWDFALINCIYLYASHQETWHVQELCWKYNTKCHGLHYMDRHHSLPEVELRMSASECREFHTEK